MLRPRLLAFFLCSGLLGPAAPSRAGECDAYQQKEDLAMTARGDAARAYHPCTLSNQNDPGWGSITLTEMPKECLLPNGKPNQAEIAKRKAAWDAAEDAEDV